MDMDMGRGDGVWMSACGIDQAWRMDGLILALILGSSSSSSSVLM
jgi:hypothetical protein